MKIFKLAPILILFFQTFANAQEEIELNVKAEMYAVQPSDAVHARSVSGDEMLRTGATDLAGALERTAGVEFSRSGAFGQRTLFLRGTPAEHVIVLVDGMEVNDPSTPTGLFDFNFSLENIERVEITRGPGSVLQSSAGIGGVINIVTKRKSSTPFSGRLSINSIPSIGTMVESGIQNELQSLTVGASLFASKGISAAGNRYGNTEADGVVQNSASAHYGMRVFDSGELLLFTRWNSTSTDLDNFGGVNGDDPNNTLASETLTSRVELRSKTNEYWNRATSVSHVRNNRFNSNPTQAGGPPQNERYLYFGTRTKFEDIETLSFSEFSHLNLGAAWTHQSSRSPSENFSHSNSDLALFAEQKIFYGNFGGRAGARYERYDSFGDAIIYRLAPQVQLNSNTTLLMSLGNAFKRPTLYQLYSNYGNRALQPEESLGGDVGIQLISDDGNVQFSFAVFKNKFTQLIDFDFVTSRYANVSSAQTEGIEVGSNVRFQRATWAFNGQALKTKDGSTGKPLLRRPQLQAASKLSFSVSDTFETFAQAQYAGARDDMAFSGPVRLASYTLADVGLRHTFFETWSCELVASNIADVDYETVSGYGNLGRTFSTAITAKF